MRRTVLTPAQTRRYQRLRARLIPAARAYRLARQPVEPAGMDVEVTADGLIHFTPTVGRHDFQVTATATLERDPDISWLGRFSDRWAPGAVVANPPHTNFCRYFHPARSYAEHRRHLHHSGHSRHHAHTLARAAIHHDLAFARDPRIATIEVVVSRAGIRLGSAGLGGTDLTDDLDAVEQVVEVITAHCLVDEAIEDARRALIALAA